MFQEIGQVHRIEKSRSDAFSYGPAGYGDGEMRLAGARAADKDDILAFGQKTSFVQGPDVRLIDCRSGKIKGIQVLGNRKSSLAKQIADRA